MLINGRLEIQELNAILAKRGLEPNGRVQRYVDSEVLRLSSPKLPFLNGILEKSGRLSTDIGSGLVEYRTPYARFLYYGKLMVGSESRSSWAKQDEIKVLTSIDLKYNGGPTRGAFWFERMKAESKVSILMGAKRMAGAK